MISFYETESEARRALSDVTLIKWPQMIVTGASVTREQAKEIIIRTDPFFSDIAPYAGGNDQEFTIRYQQQSGVLAAVSCSDRQVQERVQEAVDSVVKGEHAPVARKIRVADDVCFCSRSTHGLPWSWVAETADAIRTELQNRGLLYEEA